MLKRTIASMLVLLFLLGSTACGGNTGKNEQAKQIETAAATESTAAVTEAPTPVELLEVRNLNGATYTMVYGDDYDNQYPNFPGTQLTGDVWNDSLFERGSWAEETYNVNIVYVQDKSAATASMIKQSVTAGDKPANFYISGASSGLKSLPTGGYLANLNDFDELDLSGVWWSQLMNENLQLNGKLYVTSGDIVSALYSMLTALYLNSTILKDRGQEKDWYGIVKHGKWTLDVFYDLVKDVSRDLNGDGKIAAEDDFIGFSYLPNTVTTGAFIAGCGVKFNTIENGTIKVDLMNEKVVNAIDKSIRFFTECKYEVAKNTIYAFAEDRALAVTHLTSTPNTYFRDMKSDFLLMPQPKYDEAQENYISYSNTWTPGYIGIPLTAPKDITGIVTEALARYSYQNVRPQIVDTIMKIKVTRDEETADMLDIIFDSAYIDFSSIYDFGGTKSAIQNVLFNGANLASSMASAAEKTDAAIADFVKSWEGK